jgi:hypothetical protein
MKLIRGQSQQFLAASSDARLCALALLLRLLP